MLAKTLSKIVFEPRSFFEDDAAGMPPAVPFLFLTATLILGALGFWLIGRGVVLGRWDLRFDLILMGLVALGVIWLAVTLFGWVLAKLVGLGWKAGRTLQASAYAATPFALAWLPGLLRRFAHSGIPEIAIKLGTVIFLVILTNLALRLMHAASRGGFLKPGESVGGRKLALVLLTPVLLGVALFAAAWAMRDAPYRVSDSVVFGQVAGWESRANAQSFLTLEDIEAPDGVNRPVMNVFMERETPEVTANSIFEAYLALLQAAQYRQVSTEDAQVFGTPCRRAVFQQGENLTVVITCGARRGEIMVIAFAYMNTDEARATDRFEQVLDAMKPYSHRYHILLPGIADWEFYL
ncbi:MAG: hypothetical protein ACYC55_08520 [Candidatus Geothermincolia bacterium]